MFDPVSWGTSFLLNTTGKQFFESYFKGLAPDLAKTAQSWEKKLPDALHFNIDALFSQVSSGDDGDNFPKRKALADTLRQLRIPSREVWYDALVERWWELRDNGEENRPFFLQPPEEAEKHLRLLASQLEVICTKNKDLFQITTIGLLSEIGQSVKDQFSDPKLKQAASVYSSSFDNMLINELAVAGYVNELGGARRAIYLDKDQLYVNRAKVEELVTEKVSAFADDPLLNHQWISIVGDAGQGKSSLVWYLFNKFEEEGADVYCILAQLSGLDILDRMETGYPLLQKRSVIILDTLDLLVGIDNSRLVSIINGIRRAGHLLITTCRRQEIRGIPLKCDTEIELNLYSDEEALQAINNYIRAFYPGISELERKGQFDNIWNILDAQRKIQELDLDPLILSMIFQAYIPDKIPQDINTQKVYAQFWHARVLDDRKPSEQEKLKRIFLCLLLARSIAFSDEGSDSFGVYDLSERWAENRKDVFPEPILNQLVSSGILHWARGRTHVRFFHQTFLEYTAAMDIRHAEASIREKLLSELYAELSENVARRNPIVKQVAVQDFFEGGGLYLKVFGGLKTIHSLLSLQIALEILGKINDDGGRTRQLCQTWVAEDPSLVATTVRETIRHYPKQKIPLGLELLKPCLDTHEEISIYTACSEKLALMDAKSVHSFLRASLPRVLACHDSAINDDRRSRIREALVTAFACGVDDALDDLRDLFPLLKSGQRAGLLSSLAETINKVNCLVVQAFCNDIINEIVEVEEGEVRIAFIYLLDSLERFIPLYTKNLSQSIYASERWKTNPKIATFTGSLLGRFVIDIEMIRSLLANLPSPDPYLRLLSSWAIREAKPIYHEQILNEVIHVARRDLSEHSIQMVFKVVATLTHAPRASVYTFIQTFPWPSEVVMPDEFRQIWNLLAEANEQELKEWLWLQIQDGTGVRYRQLFLGLLVLMSKKISLFSSGEIREIYEIACKEEAVTIDFANIAGLLVYHDPALAQEIISDFLRNQKQNIRTSAIRSLALSANDHLDFTLGFGRSILAMSGKVDRYGLLHCYLAVLNGYGGEDCLKLIQKLDGWFSESYLGSLKDETAMVGVLTLLKIYAVDYPELVLEIALRCTAFTQGVAGALSAVYANVAVSLKDQGKLMLILAGLLEIIKTQQGRGQRRIRNSLRMSVPYLVRKLGAQAVFDCFFEKYKEVTSPYALEDLVRSVVVVPEWSEAESKRLLSDGGLPPQVRSIVLSRAANG